METFESFNKLSDKLSDKLSHKLPHKCSVEWYMHTSTDGPLTLAAAFSPRDVLQIVFTTWPTYVAFFNTNTHELLLQTDGNVKFLCKTGNGVGNGIGNGVDNGLGKNDNARLIGFKYVPPNYRYGAYVVYDDAIFYKKDFWHYPSVKYEKNEIPVMRNLTPRPSVFYQVK